MSKTSSSESEIADQSRGSTAEARAVAGPSPNVNTEDREIRDRIVEYLKNYGPAPIHDIETILSTNCGNVTDARTKIRDLIEQGKVASTVRTEVDVVEYEFVEDSDTEPVENPDSEPQVALDDFTE